jgi:hypothetical protein
VQARQIDSRRGSRKQYIALTGSNKDTPKLCVRLCQHSGPPVYSNLSCASCVL